MNNNQLSKAGQPWPTSERMDAIDINGNTGEHYVFSIGLTDYRLNPNGDYALYEHVPGTWRESEAVTNEMLNTEGKIKC